MHIYDCQESCKDPMQIYARKKSYTDRICNIGQWSTGIHKVWNLFSHLARFDRQVTENHVVHFRCDKEAGFCTTVHNQSWHHYGRRMSYRTRIKTMHIVSSDATKFRMLHYEFGGHVQHWMGWVPRKLTPWWGSYTSNIPLAHSYNLDSGAYISVHSTQYARQFC